MIRHSLDVSIFGLYVKSSMNAAAVHVYISLNISALDKKSYYRYFFSVCLNKNICYDPSLEHFCLGGANEVSLRRLSAP